jgi:hypothetical protein
VKEQHKITWRGIALTISFTPDWLSVADHLEIETEGRVPLPVTETGYRSHFMAKGSIESYGGPVAFVTDWLDSEAKRLGWSGAQLSLF